MKNLKSLIGISILLLAMSVLGLKTNAQQAPPPPNPGTQPCVGFLLPRIDSAAGTRQQYALGDVFVSCGGRTMRLTKMGDVLSWAMDLKSNRLLLIRASQPENHAAELVTMSLKPWKQERNLVVDPRSFLVASCGTTLLVNPLAAEPIVVDALSGQVMKQETGVTQVRCDASGGTIASLRKATSVNGGPLLLNGKILGATVTNFAVSPNGRFLAFDDDNDLCIYDKATDSKSCFRSFRQIGQLSVWDDGTVVVAAETSQACPLSRQLTTEPGRPTWPCPALFELQNGVGQSLIQFLATNPQILPRAIGEFLFSLETP